VIFGEKFSQGLRRNTILEQKNRISKLETHKV